MKKQFLAVLTAICILAFPAMAFAAEFEAFSDTIYVKGTGATESFIWENDYEALMLIGRQFGIRMEYTEGGEWRIAPNPTSAGQVIQMDGFYYVSGGDCVYRTNAPWYFNGLNNKILNVVIEDGVTEIGNNAFKGCNNITNVYYAGDEQKWKTIKIGDGNESLLSANIHYNHVIEKPIKVLLNSAEIAFDQPPIIEEGRTLVPLRAIFEALGAVVEWEGETQTVKAQKGGINISLQIGSDKMYVNGNEIVLDVPAKIVGERTMVPARAIAESFGCDVDWDGEERSVVIIQ